MNKRGIRGRGALAVTLATLSVAQLANAQLQNVVQNTVFQTANQSSNSPGAAAQITNSTFFGASWGQLNFTDDYDLSVADAFGSLQLNPGSVGFSLNSTLSFGSVSVQYPVQLNYKLPQNVQPGQPFSVTTSWMSNPNPSLTSVGLSANASLNAVLSLNASAGAGLAPPSLLSDAVYTAPQPGDPTNFSTPVPQSLMLAHANDINLVNTNLSLPIVSVGPTGSSFSAGIGGPNSPISISANVPNIAPTTNGYTNGTTLQAGATSLPLVSLNADVVSIIRTLLNAAGAPIPPLSGSYGLPFVPSTSVNYTGLSGIASIGPALAQTFSFTPTNFPITLTTADGQTASGNVGGTFTFTAPDAPGTTLGLTATTNINDTFTNTLDVVLSAQFTISALGGNMAVDGYSLFNFGPLFTKTFGYNSSPIFSASPASFQLGGFNNAVQPLSVTIIPEPVSASLMTGALVLFLGLRPRRDSQTNSA